MSVSTSNESHRIGRIVPVVRRDGDRCTHNAQNWRATWRNDPDRPGYCFLVSQWCDECRDYITQGRARDRSIAVQIEVAAAKFSIEYADQLSGEPLPCPRSFEECDVCQTIHLARLLARGGK